MRILFVLSLGGWCFSLLSPAQAAPGSWSQKADMPGQSSCPASAVVDGLLYAIGGAFPYNTALATVWVYDPTTNAWTRKADLPGPRRFAAAASVDRILYVAGGTGAGWPGTLVTFMAAYDPKLDRWTNVGTLPTPRAGPAACSVEGIFYLIGGNDGSRQLAVTEAFDPKSGRWTRKADLPRALWFPTACALNGCIYLFQGTNTFAYDPKTDSWTTKAVFSPWSFCLASAMVGETIYLFGGQDENLSASYDFAMAYDPVQDRFACRRKMPRKRLSAACGAIGGKIYLAAGPSQDPVTHANPVYYRTLDVFDPEGGVTPRIVSTFRLSTNRLALSWQGEAGIAYGVESISALATNGHWTPVKLPSGMTVTATNGLVETSSPFLPTAPQQFLRVFEAN